MFYRVQSLSEKDTRAGRYWARCESNLRGEVAGQTRFQSESAQHLKHMLEALPGIHRAWQLQHAPHPAQIGPDPAGNYMNLFEVDAPENLFDTSLGEERLPLSAGQESAGRHFARLLLKAEPRG